MNIATNNPMLITWGYWLLTLPQKNAARTLKALLSNGLTLPQKVKTEVHDRKLNILTLEELEKVILELALKGNEKAQEFSRMLVGLSLTQLWSDAFGIKFEQEERTQYLVDRQEHRKKFHPRLTAWWKQDGLEEGS